MKSVFLLIAMNLPAILGVAQMKEGRIIYERKMNLHKRIPAGEEAMKNMIPEFSTAKVQLLFSTFESIYKNLPEEQDIRETAGEGENGARVVMRFGGTEDETYKNYESGKSIEQRELGPKKYIIEDSLRNLHWKLDEGGSTKDIKGYTCRRATGKMPNGSAVEAWFSDQINCPSGPDIFGGLPGLILEVNVGDGEIVFTTVEISDKTDKKTVKAPSNGKKISRKEFQKMVEEQFGANPGGGPVIRIDRSGGN